MQRKIGAYSLVCYKVFHIPKSCKKLPRTMWIGPSKKAFRGYRELHLSLADCTSICCKIILWQVICNKCILFTFGWVNKEVKHDVYGKQQKWNFSRLSSAVCTVEWKYLYLRWIVEDIFHLFFLCVIYLRIRRKE